jgi:hypothetical protein
MLVDSCIPVIPSADLEKSLRFWVDGLGLSMDRAMRHDGRLVGCMVHDEHDRGILAAIGLDFDPEVAPGLTSRAEPDTIAGSPIRSPQQETSTLPCQRTP